MVLQLNKLRFHPVTSDRWKDFEKLFGSNGACAGCWCMWWRLSRKEFSQKQYAGNKRAIKKIIMAGQKPGILAYANGNPIGWCAIGPREAYSSLERSNVLKRVDDSPVWSVTRFYVAHSHRRQGLAGQLLKAAIRFARQRGAKIVEGYPIDSGGEKKNTVSIFTGLASTFIEAGFFEVERRTPTRPIMRYFIH
ncbi:MAG: GNAT family N-acetyltransferase [Acidobacteriota bacterium]